MMKLAHKRRSRALPNFEILDDRLLMAYAVLADPILGEVNLTDPRTDDSIRDLFVNIRFKWRGREFRTRVVRGQHKRRQCNHPK